MYLIQYHDRNEKNSTFLSCVPNSSEVDDDNHNPVVQCNVAQSDSVSEAIDWSPVTLSHLALETL